MWPLNVSHEIKHKIVLIFGYELEITEKKWGQTGDLCVEQDKVTLLSFFSKHGMKLSILL